MFRRLKPDENRRKPPTSVQNGASRSGPKNQANGRSVFELSPPRLRPHLSKTDRFRASPPTPPRLASLRFAYTYTQAQAFGWLSWHTVYIYIYTYIYIAFLDFIYQFTLKHIFKLNIHISKSKERIQYQFSILNMLDRYFFPFTHHKRDPFFNFHLAPIFVQR